MFLMTRFAPAVPVEMIVLAEQMSGLVRCVVGYILVKRRTWVRNLTLGAPEKENPPAEEK